jgi:hypothetical protein
MLQVLRGASDGRIESLLSRAGRLADELDDPWLEGLLKQIRGLHAFAACRWQQALDLLQEAEVQFRTRCTGVAYELDNIQSFQLYSLMWQGRWRELGQRLPPLLAEARQTEDRYAEQHLSMFAATMALAADDPAAAEGHLEVLRARLPEGRMYLFQHWLATWLSAELALYRGDAEGALGVISGAWPAIRRSRIQGVVNIQQRTLWLRARCALAAASRGGTGSRLRRALGVTRRLERTGGVWAEGCGLLLRAGVASVRGEPQRAAELLKHAEEVFEAGDMALFRWLAARRRGGLADDEAGRALVQEADTWLSAQDVANPGRLSDLLLPGRWVQPG